MTRTMHFERTGRMQDLEDDDEQHNLAPGLRQDSTVTTMGRRGETEVEFSPPRISTANSDFRFCEARSILLCKSGKDISVRRVIQDTRPV